jgi:hypothetical protein
VVLVSFLRAVGLPTERMSDDLDAQIGAHRSAGAQRRILVVLDNAASAEQTRPLLPGGPGCFVVVTSRAALTGLVVGEAAHRMFVDLFTSAEGEDMVRAMVGADRAAAEPDASAALIRLCAQLPLALRVATARLAANADEWITEVVDDMSLVQSRLDLLSNTGDDRTAVRPVFDWSYARLPAEQARLFRRLGAHSGLEFGIGAVAALSDTDLTTTRRLLTASPPRI